MASLTSGATRPAKPANHPRQTAPAPGPHSNTHNPDPPHNPPPAPPLTAAPNTHTTQLPARSGLGSGEYELRWFIEVDRSSESVPVIVRKCQLYADYYQSGKEQAAQGGVFPRVCWIVPDDQRAERLRRAIHRDRSLPDRLFVVVTNARALDILREVDV
jgi:hypothetical protein